MGTCFGRCFNTKFARRYESRQTFYFPDKDVVEFDFLVEKEEPIAQGYSLPRSISSFLSMRRKKASRSRVSLELVEDSWAVQISDDPVQSYLPSLHCCESAVVQPSMRFQALDPRGLLANQQQHSGLALSHGRDSINSTPPSSLDLEWEHEGISSVTCYPSNRREEEGDSDSAATSVSSNRPKRHHRLIHHSLRQHNGSRHGSITHDSSTATASKEGSRMTTPDSLDWDFIDASDPGIDQETEQLLGEIERLTARALEETGGHLLKSVERLPSDDESN